MRARTTVTLHREECEAYAVGLEALSLLKTHFPDVYERNAGCPVTPEKLLGVVSAFFQLVQERHDLPLMWPEDEAGELDFAEDPDDTLVMYDGVSVEFMRDLGHYVFRARPAYYGLGVQLLIDEGYSTASPLRLALYWLAQDTDLDIGIDVPALINEARGLPPHVEATIAELPRLPRGTGMRELVGLAARDIPEAAELADPASLILYVFGRTGNPLADTNEHEQLHVYGMYSDEWDWSELAEMVALSKEARKIEAAFEAWHRRFVDGGARAVEELAETFQRHARTLRRRDKRQAKAARTLIDILPTSEEIADDDDTHPAGAALAAWAAGAAAD